MLTFLGILAAAVVVTAILLWLSPYRMPRNFRVESIAAVRSKFDPVDRNGRILEYICCFSLCIPIAFGWYSLEQYLLFPRLTGYYIYQFTNPVMVYVIPSLFLSFLLGGFLAYYLIFLYVYVRGLGTREEFGLWGILWERKKVMGSREIRGPVEPEVKRYSILMGITTILIVFGAFLTSCICLDCYTVITPDQIRTNSILEFQDHEYTYDQVDRILLLDRIRLRSGKIEIRENPEYQIFFRDGTRSTTRYWPYGIPGDQLRESVEYISSRSGVPIRKGIVNVDVPADFL
jgi:hypothetical protein